MFEKLFSRLGYEKKEAPDYGQPISGAWGLPVSGPYRFTNLSYSSGGRNDYSVSDLSQSSLVMAVVNDTGTALSEALPSCKKPGSKGKWKVDPGHPAAQLVQRPNPFNVWSDYCGALSLDWWVDGNFYLLKARDSGGKVVELWYLPACWVEPRWPDDKATPGVPTSGPNKAQNDHLSHYQYTVPGKTPELIPASDVIHIKRFVRKGNVRKGVGAFEPLITEIYGDNKAGEFTATILKNMGIVVPLLSPKEKSDTISPTQAEEIKQKWLLGTTGANAGMPMINSIPIEATKFAFSPQELDLKALRTIPESRVAAITRYPAAYLQFLVGLENGTSYASYKEAREQAYEQVVAPIQKVIEENFTWQLVRETDKVSRFAFDTTEVKVLQEDRDSLYKRNLDALVKGGMSLNEFREAIGLDSIKEGDIYFIPSNVKPVTSERLTEMADGSLAPEPVDPNAQPVDPALVDEQVAKLLDMEKLFKSLERQMRGFEVRK